MAEQTPRKVADFKPKPHAMMARIRELAKSSDNVVWTDHSLEQLCLRDLTTLDALRVLRLGEILGGIEPGANLGEWKCLVSARKKGSREIGVVTLLCNQNELVIKTVMWVDE